MPRRNKKRDWSIIALLALVVTIGIFGFDVFTNQASIDYGISPANGFSDIISNVQNTVNVWCDNGGGSDGSFYLNVKLINATVPTQQSYMVNSTFVKIPFLLHKSGANQDKSSLNVDFNIDKDVSGFSFSISLEKRGNGLMSTTCYGNNPLQYNLTSYEVYSVVNPNG